ncbi:MAG: amino acid ABC transporter substrate-binding protein [Epsilonproteobacteria bacterium]|nr:amino acid ABC transporter substrate-binding protein [Campylobacterota bacterium]
MKKILFLLVIVSALFSKDVIYICDDAAEWPPFVFYKRDHGKVDRTKLVGALVDMYNVIFKDLNMTYKLDLLPWKRCTNLVERYDVAKKYAIFPGVYNERRAKILYVSKPIYFTHQVIWYSKKKFTKKELLDKIKNNPNSLKICDVNGYNTAFYYKVFNLDKNKKINQEATSQCAVLKKISAGRCDIMVASKEAILGYQMIGKCDIPKDISYIPYKTLSQTKFRLFIAKSYPHAKELLEKINKEIDKLDESGLREKIMKKWVK